MESYCSGKQFEKDSGVSVLCGQILYPLGMNAIISCKLTCQGEVIAGYLKSAMNLSNSNSLYCNIFDGKWKTNFKVTKNSCFQNIYEEVAPLKLDFFTTEIIKVSDASYYLKKLIVNY